MITRVTQQTMVRSAQRNLQTNASEMARLQEKATSQKKNARMSDDPVAGADSIKVRQQIAAESQYARNIDDGNGWLTTIDSALNSTLDLLHRARDLSIQGANGASSPDSRAAIAKEIVQLRDELLTQANTKYVGRSVFAGTSDAGVAFADDLTWTGTPGSTVERRIGTDTTVRVDANGAAIFGTGAASVFATFDQVAQTLVDGGDVAAHLNDIDAHMDSVIGVLAEIGSRHAQIERADKNNLDSQLTLEGRRSGIEDVDMAEVIMDLQMQEVAYQAALGATAKVLQPTLMDFLR